MEPTPRELEIYETVDGKVPFEDWLNGLKDINAIFKKQKNIGRIIVPKRTKKYEESLIDALKNPKEAAAYLNAHLEENEPEEIFLLALRDVAHAHGFREIAEQTSLGRESLYKTLSKDGNPKLSTLKALLASMGLKLSIQKSDKKAVGF